MSTVKNYGIAGVAADLQLGKKGGRMVYADGIFNFVAQDGVTVSRVKVADAVENSEAVSLLQLNTIADQKITDLNLGTMSTQDAESVAITGGTVDGAAVTGGTVDGTVIGGTTAAAGTFTDVTAVEVFSDTISESTIDAGVTVDGVVLKDSGVEAASVKTDSIVESTLDAGVTIEGTTFATGGHITAGGDLIIQGNLTVNGDTTTLDVTNLAVEDNIIEINSGETGAGVTAGSAGFDINRGTELNAQIIWDEATDTFKLQYSDGTLASLEANLTSLVGPEQGGFGVDISGYDAESLVKADGSELAVGLDSQVLTAELGVSSYKYVDAVRRAADGKKVIDTVDATSVDAEYLDFASEVGALTLTARNEAGTGDVDLILVAQGNGDVLIGSASDPSVLAAQDNQTLTVSGGAGAGADAGDLILSGGAGDSTFTSGDVILQGGAGGSAEGITVIRDSAGNDVARFEAGDALAVDFFSVKNGLGEVSLEAQGETADIDLVLSPKGTGVVVLPAGYDISTAADEAVVNKGYLDSQLGAVAENVDPLILRSSIAADSASSTFSIGTMSNIDGKSYYVHRVVLHVTSAFSGGTVDHIVATDGTTVLASEQDSDVEAGTYVVDLPFADATAGGASVDVQFFQADGTTAAVPTAGSMVAVVEYKVV